MTTQLRTNTSANWSAVNPILSQGEPGYESDTGKLKIGDGISFWNDLSHFAGSDNISALVDTVGYTGSRGATGPVGAMGPIGFTGSAGSGSGSSTPGFSGSRGFTGSLGEKGFAGSVGAVSTTPGFAGSRGFTGSASTAAGAIGPSGAKGITGDRGFTGSASTAAGAMGLTGASGAKGDKGYTGSGGSGPTGPMGPIGYTGSSATAGGGVLLQSRVVLTVDTASLAVNATGSIDLVNAFKGYVLYKVETSAAAWIRIYTNAANRTKDVQRTKDADPAIDSGVIAEVITSAAGIVSLTPAVIGFNDEAPPTRTIPMSVTNLSSAAGRVTLKLTLVQIEA
jgi:hypothetical protein